MQTDESEFMKDLQLHAQFASNRSHGIARKRICFSSCCIENNGPKHKKYGIMSLNSKV